MALDLHVLRNRQPAELLYSIGQDQYQRIEPALRLFEERTGLQVDLYADLRLTCGLGPLIQAVTDALASEVDVGAKREMETFAAVLRNAESKMQSLIFVGD